MIDGKELRATREAAELTADEAGKRHRRTATLTQEELAARVRALGEFCTRDYVAKVEGGRAGDISSRKAAAIARALGVSIESLLEGVTP